MKLEFLFPFLSSFLFFFLFLLFARLLIARRCASCRKWSDALDAQPDNNTRNACESFTRLLCSITNQVSTIFGPQVVTLFVSMLAATRPIAVTKLKESVILLLLLLLFYSRKGKHVLFVRILCRWAMQCHCGIRWIYISNKRGEGELVIYIVGR